MSLGAQFDEFDTQHFTRQEGRTETPVRQVLLLDPS